MRRILTSWTGGEPAALEPLPQAPSRLTIPRSRSVNRCDLEPTVAPGDRVAAGETLLRGDALHIHAAAEGIVEACTEAELLIRCTHGAVRVDPDVTRPEDRPPPPDRPNLPDFAAKMGLVGMGGSQFPYAIKLGTGTDLHTLVLNAVECEPGLQIDEALLLYDLDTVREGLQGLASALGCRRLVLAAKSSAKKRLASPSASLKAELTLMPNRYPGGAERLILKRLTGRIPPAGVLPVSLGVLISSVASVWAIGRRLRFGEPSILRPLTFVPARGDARNLIVPVGTPVGEVLSACHCAVDDHSEILITGGKMMGTAATVDSPVLKGTNAIFVLPMDKRLSRDEIACLLCGACFDACPLSLHPSAMADRLRKDENSAALQAQLNECFLCGLCSAVCPADIPLVQIFRDGKRRNRP